MQRQHYVMAISRSFKGNTACPVSCVIKYRQLRILVSLAINTFSAHSMDYCSMDLWQAEYVGREPRHPQSDGTHSLVPAPIPPC